MKLTKRERDIATSLLRSALQILSQLDDDYGNWDDTRQYIEEVSNFMMDMLYPKTKRPTKKKKK